MSDNSTLLLGIHSVASGLAARRGKVRRLLLQSDSSNPRLRELRSSAKQNGVAVEEVSRDALDQLAEGNRHQGVAAWFDPANLLAENDLPKLLMDGGQSPLFLILDGVQDPHNLGACLRSADAAGVAAVIMPKNRAAPITPVVRRAAAGAAEHIPIVQVTNLARTMRLLKQKGIWIAGTSDQAGQSIYQADLQGPLALVMGSEGQGMRHLTAELCDFLFCLPMLGEVESLNVSVATGICLFEALRQRQN